MWDIQTWSIYSCGIQFKSLKDFKSPVRWIMPDVVHVVCSGRRHRRRCNIFCQNLHCVITVTKIRKWFWKAKTRNLCDQMWSNGGPLNRFRKMPGYTWRAETKGPGVFHGNRETYPLRSGLRILICAMLEYFMKLKIFALIYGVCCCKC